MLAEVVMWADNETDEDLLGFDFVVDSLFVALTEPRLLPLTIGLLGDWGSGKSSVLKIVHAELEALRDGDELGHYVCVEFSPWQYEDYDDVKVALMAAVLDRLEREVTDTEEQERVSWLRRRLRAFRGRGRAFGRMALTTAPAALSGMAGFVDPSLASPELVQAGTSILGAAAGAGEQALQDPPNDAERGAGADPTGEVRVFKEQFATLVGNLTHVRAVVVLIDDLDRCLPESVVDTFEAVRLFLNSPKTAFVVAAHQLVVESAIDSRYPELRRADGSGIGADYLEKMLQLKVTIPALSAAEAETYMNLLLAELWLADEQFTTVRETVRQRRVQNPLGVGFNLGVAEACLGVEELPKPLVDDLMWAGHIAPALTGGLRGNPRQLKRFLNNVMLRLRSAQRRSINLNPAVIAKLLVLEEQHFGDFKKLFDWQMAATGTVEQLRLAEAHVRGSAYPADGDQPDTPADGPDRIDSDAGGANPPTVPRSRVRARRGADPDPGPRLSSEVAEWIGREHLRAWLQLEPALAGHDLRPYFTYARDKLSLGVVAARLAPRLQELLANLQSDVVATRRAAVNTVTTLEVEEREQLMSALLDAVVRNPAGLALTAAAELVARIPDVVQIVCEALMQVPVSAVPAQRVASVARNLPLDHPAVVALLDRWQGSGVSGLERAVATARRLAAQSGR
ncbi:P-loop NTPase fold protein [Micromonospora carbonacea]|nr:P-loop NTPase fold protein [Micromonospora carbonacea]